jgi:FkbM family methyltransferase
MLKVLAKKIVRRIRWILYDVYMVIKAPKVDILTKIVLLFCFIAYHIFKIKFYKFKIFVNVNGIKYKLIDHDTLKVLSYSELWMDKYLDIRNGQVFIDVGAHVGKYALKIAKRNPRSTVIAIEPGSLQFNALIDGINKNKLKNIIPLNIAAWDSTTKLKLKVYSIDTGTSSVIPSMPGIGHLIRVENVDAKPLDDVVNELGIKHVDWVKIDVEGAELHVLRGFRNGIIKFKPRVVIEIKEFNRREVFKFFEEVNYTCHHIPEDESGEYFICIPQEQVVFKDRK